MDAQPLPVEQRIQGGPIIDFDALFSEYPPCLRGVVAALPLNSDFTHQRAKFVALREWIMLSSAFDLPCYAQPQIAPGSPNRLWMRTGTLWIGEEELDHTPLRLGTDEPSGLRRHEVLVDPLLRHHANLALLRIEAAFQQWGATHPDAVVAILRPPRGTARDVSLDLLQLPVEWRHKSVATMAWRAPGSAHYEGKLSLYRPSDALVAQRTAMRQATRLADATVEVARSGSRRL